MKFPHGVFTPVCVGAQLSPPCSFRVLMIVQLVVTLEWWVTASYISPSFCLRSSHTVLPSQLSGCVWFSSSLFYLNLNSLLDSTARQNKLFKSFNEEVQSTDTSVQTHLEHNSWHRVCVRICVCVYVYVCVCVCFCVFVKVAECVTELTHCF